MLVAVGLQQRHFLIPRSREQTTVVMEPAAIIAANDAVVVTR